MFISAVPLDELLHLDDDAIEASGCSLRLLLRVVAKPAARRLDVPLVGLSNDVRVLGELAHALVQHTDLGDEFFAIHIAEDEKDL